MGQKIPAMFHVSKFLSLKSLHFNFALIMSVWEPSPGKESKITRGWGWWWAEPDAISLCRFCKSTPNKAITSILSLVHMTLTLVFASVHSLDASEIF